MKLVWVIKMWHSHDRLGFQDTFWENPEERAPEDRNLEKCPTEGQDWLHRSLADCSKTLLLIAENGCHGQSQTRHSNHARASEPSLVRSKANR